jgi:hypothetical protein
MTVPNGGSARQQRQAEVDRWIDQMYQAQAAQRGQKQAGEKGRDLVGEELAWKVERALERHSPVEIQAVLEAARQVATKMDRAELVRNGRLTGTAVTAVPGYTGSTGSAE